MKRPATSADGRCAVLTEVCREPALPGRYLCERHAAELEQRAARLRQLHQKSV